MALASDKEKIDWLIKRVSTADFQINVGEKKSKETEKKLDYSLV